LILVIAIAATGVDLPKTETVESITIIIMMTIMINASNIHPTHTPRALLQTLQNFHQVSFAASVQLKPFKVPNSAMDAVRQSTLFQIVPVVVQSYPSMHSSAHSVDLKKGSKVLKYNSWDSNYL
jgi:hypothetical protein